MEKPPSMLHSSEPVAGSHLSRQVRQECTVMHASAHQGAVWSCSRIHSTYGATRV